MGVLGSVTRGVESEWLREQRASGEQRENWDGTTFLQRETLNAKPATRCKAIYDNLLRNASVAARAFMQLHLTKGLCHRHGCTQTSLSTATRTESLHENLPTRLCPEAACTAKGSVRIGTATVPTRR